MVLSNAKLKRKRKEEAIAAGTWVDHSTNQSADSKVEVKVAGDVQEEKKKKRKKTKDTATHGGGSVEVGAAGGGVEAVKASEGLSASAAKNLKKKEKRKKKALAAVSEADPQVDDGGRSDVGNEATVSDWVEPPTGNGNVVSAREMAGAGENGGKLGKKQKTPGKKKGGKGGSNNNSNEVEGSTCYKSEYVQPTEEVVAVDESVTAGGEENSHAEKVLTVREKKGKGKKKDRWGGAVREDDVEGLTNTYTAADEAEYKAQTSLKVTEPLSSGEEYDQMKVYVGGMPYYVSEDDIHEYFSECGTISELDCVIFPDTGKFRGLAFITFQTEEGARMALELDGCDMGGRFLKIEKCKLKKPSKEQKPEVKKYAGCSSVYIGNLSWDITEDAIRSFLKKNFRETKIEAIRLSYDKESGEFKGFGHVDFADEASLDAAVMLNQKPLLGRPVKIAYSVPKRTPTGGEGFRNNANNGNNTNNGNSSGRKSGACYTCGMQGHKTFLCPQKQTA